MDDKKPSPRILIIDDLPDNIEVLANSLGDDYEISISTSGASALELIERQKPDLILLDIMMPGMNGFELMECLKSNARHFTIPVIFVTARIDAESETEALDAGAADFIHKPINPPVVRARVRQQLEMGQYRTHLETLVQARTQALAAERDRAEAASRAKSAFLANMSHELRTPLHQVFGLSELLARKQTDDAAVKYLGLIKQSSQQLLELLSGLLDIAQLEANSLRLESQDFDLGALLEDVTEPVRQVAAAKGLVFQCVRDIRAQTVLHGDPRLLKKILEQLLNNSIKFSERGGHHPGHQGRARKLRESGPALCHQRRGPRYDAGGQGRSVPAL